MKGVRSLATSEIDDALMKQFPPLIPITPGEQLPLINGPAVFTDVDGVIIAWSLPAVLPDGFTVSESTSMFVSHLRSFATG